MDRDKKPFVRRAEVLKKLNTENLQLIERGLLGDLPERFKPVPTREQSSELVVAKPTSLLSSCLPIVPDSPPPYPEKRSPSLENLSSSPLKKSFSFRDRLRMGFFGKDKEKTKWKTINEEDSRDLPASLPRPRLKRQVSSELQSKSNKRFWFFRHKEFIEKRDKVHSPIYQRSKSFEFLPRLENESLGSQAKATLTNSNSYAYGSSDTLESSNGSADYANVYYDKDNTICLKSIKVLQESDHNSSISTATSASSGIVLNIMKSESMQDLLDEFDKAVDLFSENYLSDCEPYTRTDSKLTVNEKRKSSSFATLPSPKILQVNKVDKVSDEFKDELTKILSVRHSSASARSPRRGSVTDWFVLEDKVAEAGFGKVMEISDRNKYRRAQNKPVKLVRRMSSTKYWITPEECEVYSRERRPPLVIPRITQYRAPRRSPRQTPQIPYPEQEVCDVPAKSWQYSPTPDRSRIDLERSFTKATYDSPSMWSAKRLGGSTENLLGNLRRPTHLQLPASSSGDSLDVEIRERKPYQQERSRSMMAPKPKSRAPQPSPRLMDVRSEKKNRSEDPIIDRRYIKRTKYMEGGKKCKKNWVESYMTLTPTSIRFYKNENTYYATMRDPPSPSSTPRPELVIMLHSAYVELSQHSQTRRHSRSLVLTQGNDQYLLQDESEESARNLLRRIQNVIGRLGPSYMMVEDRPSPVCSSGTDAESVGRTPPVSRHAAKVKQKAGGSSIEDLSDSTEVVTKSDVRSKLKRFFAKRPSMDVLVKNGIYKDEPVFGRKLEEVCPAASPRVPEFVKACIREIESSEENMGTDGLYRASGNLSQVQKIRLEVDQNNFSVIENNTDIHVLTGSLKLFFRELKEPLIPFTLFDRVLAACSIKPREARIKEFRDIIQSLPQCNRDTLKYLLEHLLKVTLYSERNRMHTANLAIVFGPTLLWAEKAENIAIDCIQQNHVVDILLNDFREIFVEDTKVKKKA